jgi:hypothetical protein
MPVSMSAPPSVASAVSSVRPTVSRGERAGEYNRDTNRRKRHPRGGCARSARTRRRKACCGCQARQRKHTISGKHGRLAGDCVLQAAARGGAQCRCSSCAGGLAGAAACARRQRSRSSGDRHCRPVATARRGSREPTARFGEQQDEPATCPAALTAAVERDRRRWRWWRRRRETEGRLRSHRGGRGRPGSGRCKGQGPRLCTAAISCCEPSDPGPSSEAVQARKCYRHHEQEQRCYCPHGERAGFS